MTTTPLTRRHLYQDAHNIWPDEMIGATDLECEMDIRGINRTDYEIKGYCSNKTAPRCSECSLCNYGLDCHNNRIA